MSSVVPAQPEHPWLLPASLTADPTSTAPHPRRSTRDWVVDALFFLVASGYAVVAFWDVLSPRPTMVPERADSELAVVIDMVLTTALCLSLWVRRRWPVGLAVAALPVAFFSTPSGIAILIILLTVVVHRRLAVAGPLVLAHFVAGVVYEFRHPDPVDGPVVGLVITVLLTGSVLAWGMFVRARRQLVLSWRDRAIRAEAEQRLRVEAARRMERTRIAREMHDVLAHRISLLSLHAGALEFRPDAPPEEISRAAGVIRTSARQALEELREVINVLREDPPEASPEPDRGVSGGPHADRATALRRTYEPDPPYPPVPGQPSGGEPAVAGSGAPAGEPERSVAAGARVPEQVVAAGVLDRPVAEPARPQPTLADLPELVEECRAAGMRVELRTELVGVENAPAGMGRGAYRIVQEGLTNARKHAPGTVVTVSARGRAGLGLTVEVRNRWPVGRPAEPNLPGTGTGLVGLAERTALLGGWLEHGRTETGDFRLAAWLPWPS
ncbi:sensor histidine kinase [Micromonospora sp. HM5-17]|uniref:sensor histidine kinase n=1 Tax=Micromonospora sp. HM5-17 TaxID=2487710 RepID=UPI000F471AAE|nr:histidine kinase [Micromonospora sp. HM5-17]ROT31680.1 sensor histidine kinase [Micromonospora sp. HM5-17]